MSELRIKWLGVLAKLVTPNDPAKAFSAMEAYLPFLADLPDSAFCRASLEAVAMAHRRLHIPDLSEIKGPLSAWWRENRPRPTAIAAPAKPEPEIDATTPEQRAAMAAQISALVDSLAPRTAQKPRVRAHVFAPAVLAELRERQRKGFGA